MLVKMAVQKGEFFCETCDRGWKTQEKLDEHVAEHQVCGRDGCTFTGHPKIIRSHIMLQHDSGLFNKIVTKNQEDVEKWIAERKRRFPSVKNVEKKKEQEKEMFERGERMPRQDKRFQNRKNFSNRGNKRMWTSNNESTSEKPLRKKINLTRNKKANEEDKWKDPESWNGGLPRFPGTAAFPDVDLTKSSEEATQFSDEEESLPGAEIHKKEGEKPLISSVLASLADCYGTDVSDEEIESVLPYLQKRGHTNMSLAVDEVANKFTPRKEVAQAKEARGEDSDSGPEESGVDREDKSNVPMVVTNKEHKIESDTRKKSTDDKGPTNRRATARPFVPRHQLTLLEKLLKNEIRHERNVILQCVRYVVKNNFFMKS